MKRIVVLGLLVLGTLVVPAPLGAQKAKGQKELLRWKGKAPLLYVRNLNGPLELVGTAAGSEIEVVAVATWEGSEPAHLKAEAKTSASGVTICALYGERFTCGPDGDYEASGRNHEHNGGSITFQVKLPKGVKLDVEMVNGEISAKGLAADADIETVNGRVEIEQEAGALDVESVNGKVKVVTRSSGELDVETVNGSIEIALAKGASAEVSAETLNGRIEIGGERFQRSGKKTLGKGGRRIDAETVNGSITVQ